ncbi:AAA-ATPase [Pacmanvirus S19]|nr:AAA-ATPase [Pacmanvirus S19]
MQSGSIDMMASNMMNMMFLTVGSSLVTSLATTITKVLVMLGPWLWYYIKKLFEPKQNTVIIQYTTKYSVKHGTWISIPGERENISLIKAIIEFISGLPEQPEITKCNLGIGVDNGQTGFNYEKSRELEIAPCKSITYNGFKIDHTEESQESEKGDGERKKTSVTVSSRKSNAEITKFIQDCYHNYITRIYKPDENKKEPTYLFKQIPSKEGLRFKKYPISNTTNFDSLYFPEKEKMVDLADRVNSGKLNKLALLLYGKPGCGKTSLIKAMAAHLDYHIIEVKLSFMVNDAALMDMFHNKPLISFKHNDPAFGTQTDYIPLNKRIYIFEDVDAESKVIHQRCDDEPTEEECKESTSSTEEAYKIMMKKYMKKEKLTLSGILNVLDGIIEINGSVIIMTTNHPEKLDEAFKRPGRITASIELKKMLAVEANKLIKNKFGKKIESIHDYVFTPAQMSSFCQIASDFNELKQLVENYQNQ